MKLHNKEVRWSEEKKYTSSRISFTFFGNAQRKNSTSFHSTTQSSKISSSRCLYFGNRQLHGFFPFIEENDYIFLKNMIPKREYKYLIPQK